MLDPSISGCSWFLERKNQFTAKSNLWPYEQHELALMFKCNCSTPDLPSPLDLDPVPGALMRKIWLRRTPSSSQVAGSCNQRLQIFGYVDFWLLIDALCDFSVKMPMNCMVAHATTKVLKEKRGSPLFQFCKLCTMLRWLRLFDVQLKHIQTALRHDEVDVTSGLHKCPVLNDVKWC